MNPRSGAAFSLVVALIVAVVVGVVLLLSDSNGDGQGTRTPPQANLSCQFEAMGGEVRIVFDPAGGSCTPARRIYQLFLEMAQRNEVEGYEPAPVGGWDCREYPFSEYPLLAQCVQGDRHFEVLGLAPSAHEGG